MGLRPDLDQRNVGKAQKFHQTVLFLPFISVYFGLPVYWKRLPASGTVCASWRLIVGEGGGESVEMPETHVSWISTCTIRLIGSQSGPNLFHCGLRHNRSNWPASFPGCIFDRGLFFSLAIANKISPVSPHLIGSLRSVCMENWAPQTYLVPPRALRPSVLKMCFI